MRNLNSPQTYVDKDDLWSGILVAAEFAIRSTKNRIKYYSPGKLVPGCDIILPIKHNVYWELIYQQNHKQINKDNIRENIIRVDHNYKVGDKVILTNNAG